MNKKLYLSFFSIFLATFCNAKNVQVESAQQNVRYWIAYTNGDKNFLAQIDSSGNVVRTPKEIVFPERVRLRVQSISKNGANFLNLWSVHGNDFIYRVIVNKRTLNIIKIIKTPLKTTGLDVDVTQRAINNFLIFEKPNPLSAHSFDFVGQGVFPTGVVSSGPFVLNRGAFVHFLCCSSQTVSSDGRTIVWFETPFIFFSNQLTVRILDDTGRQPLRGSTLLSEGATRASAISVSNVLSSDTVFVIYSWGSNIFKQDLFLQPISVQTGQVSGARINLRKGQFGAVAIDPLGKFVLFSATNQQRDQLLFFQALDLTGHRNGPAKILLRNVDISRLDILKQ